MTIISQSSKAAPWFDTKGQTVKGCFPLVGAEFWTAKKGHLVKTNTVLQLNYGCTDWLQFCSLKTCVGWQSHDEALFVRGEKQLWGVGQQRTHWLQCQPQDLWGQETRVKYEAAWQQSCLKLTLLTLEDNQGTDCSTAVYNCQPWGDTTSGWPEQSPPGRVCA